MKNTNDISQSAKVAQAIAGILFTLVAALAVLFGLGSPVPERLEQALNLRVDSLSVLVGLMVSLLGFVVSSFSLRYLAGDRRQNQFYFSFLWTLISVLLMVFSGHLLMFFCFWLMTSFGLHRLLCL
ncbi:MAG: hypothetical protein K2X47_01820, partial [Bdellovibrionales bacterium]|nr:hypothetical protein [Bdellovibrionales bacterium]